MQWCRALSAISALPGSAGCGVIAGATSAWGTAAGAANTSDSAVSPIAATVAIEQAFIQSAIRDLDAPISVTGSGW